MNTWIHYTVKSCTYTPSIHDLSMIILFSVLSGLCSFLWYGLLGSLLESVGISPQALVHPYYTHGCLAIAYGMASSSLYGVFAFVGWYQQASVSHRAKTFSFVGTFLGLHLGVLLRSILIFRTEIAERNVYSLATTFPLEEMGIQYWGFGGALSAVVIVFAILITLSLLQSS